MIGFDGMQATLSIFVFHRPGVGSFMVRTGRYFAAHLQFAPHGLHLFGARFPHHAWTSPRVTERIDERLDYLASISIVALRKNRVLDRAAERKSLNALRCPVCGDFFAAHSPNLFGIAFEECVEESSAELVADPFFEIARIADWEEARFQPGKDAEQRFED